MLGWIITAAILAALLAAGALWERHCRRQDAAAYPCPGKMVDIPGARMHVLAQGEGPRIVLLTGWNTAVPSVDFQPLARELNARGFRVVIPEKPGYGYSTDSDVPRQLDTVVDELRLALREAGEEGPYLLLGHSMAGTELVRWACRFPEEVRAIYSLDAPAPMCYTTVPLPPLFARHIQRFQHCFGLKRISMAIPRFRKSYWKYLNQYAYLDPVLLPIEKAMVIKNGGSHATWNEMKLLRANAKVAGGDVPEGIPVMMFIASDTHDQRWDALQPTEDEFIARNHARTLIVEGMHNLQHFQPALIAQTIAADKERLGL